MPALSPTAKAALRNAIAEVFSIDELKMLCSDLGEDPENIGGIDRGKLYWTMEIIGYFENRGRSGPLLDQLAKERGNVPWLRLAAGEIQPEAAAAAAPYRPTAPGTLRVFVAQMPDLHDTITRCSADLQNTYSHIQGLSNFKELHDLFQELDDAHQILFQASKRLPADETAWDDIANVEPEVQIKAARLVTAAQQVIGDGAGVGALWTGKLNRASTDLAAAVQAEDIETLRKAAGVFTEVIGAQLSRLNVQLVGAAKEVRLSRLVGVLASVRDQLSAVNLAVQNFAAELKTFSQSVDDLASHSARLDALTHQHDQFQQAEDELRRIQAQLAVDLSELEYVWGDLKPLLQQLCEGQAEKWAQDLLGTAADLDAALTDTSKNPRRIRTAFNRYCAQATQRFNQVNADLIAQCRQLRQADGPLASIWRLVA